ncbi:MAG: pilus assembly protein PilP [Piscirickettsiaceae bacterium]|nr:pilus assembly protein PilP [Piscirickettsiaceae bacterium]
MINVIKLLIFVLAVLLTACQQEKEDLASYVAAVQAKQISDIDPIPVMKSYEKFTYSAAELRDPFVPTVVEVAAIEDEMPLEDNGIHPEEHRLKEALESYSLSELQFVGTLEKESIFALIRASDGVIHRVQVGNYMGQYHGKILMVSETEITLNEIVPEGKNRFVERESSLSVVDVN